MSEQLDYVNTRIDKARATLIDRFISGFYKNLPSQEISYDSGYLKALEDVEEFQKDYAKAKNPPREEDDPLEAA